MDLVGDDRFLVGLERDVKLDGLGVGFLEILDLLFHGPVVPAVEVLDDADFSGLFLAVADFDLEGFLAPIVGVNRNKVEYPQRSRIGTECVMYAFHGHATFAYRGRAALDGAGADVTGGEDAGAARF